VERGPQARTDSHSLPGKIDSAMLGGFVGFVVLPLLTAVGWWLMPLTATDLEGLGIVLLVGALGADAVLAMAMGAAARSYGQLELAKGLLLSGAVLAASDLVAFGGCLAALGRSF
jgi:hypothetical protein